MKVKIRDLTRRNWSISMEERIRRINQYLNGWLGYFALADDRGILTDLDQWLRHRMRAWVWKQWKRVRTRCRELRRLGLPEWKAHEIANARKGPWRMAHGPLNNVLTIAYWREQGLIDLVVRYQEIRQLWRTAGYGPARRVV